MKEFYDTEILELYKAGNKEFSRVIVCGKIPDISLNRTLVDYPVNLKSESLSGINLSHSDLHNANLENTNLSEAKLISTNLRTANLQGANLQNAVLQGADLSYANLKNANLSGVDLSKTLLTGAILNNTIIDEKTLFDCKTYLIWQIVNQKLSNKNLIGIDLTGACLDYADLSEVNLSYAKLGYLIDQQSFRERSYCTSLRFVNFTGANLEYAELIGAKLVNANLRKANLQGAKLVRASLKNAQLDEAILNKADLTQSNLVRASCKRASLYETILYGAKLSNSNLCESDLRKTVLLETSLDSVTLRGAYYDEDTKFPALFNPKNKRMISRIKQDEYNDFLNSLLIKKGKKEKNPPPRPGQDEFRNKLLDIYKGRCIISGCDIEEVLEAAHIIPFNGLHSHNIANGLLLRSDLHKLFDKYLLAIHPNTRKVLLAPELLNTYNEFAGKQVEVYISDENLRKQRALLNYHYQQCNWLK